MEPYSADKIKRKKRKYHNPKEEIIPLTTDLVIPFQLIVRKDTLERYFHCYYSESFYRSQSFIKFEMSLSSIL